MGDYKDWSFKQRDHQRCSCWNTTNYWHYAPPRCDPPPCPPPSQATIMPPPPPFPSTPNLQSFVNNHSYMQTKGREMQVVLLNARDFLIPSYFFMFWKSCCSFFPSSILSFTPLFMHRLICTRGSPRWLQTCFFEGKNWFKPKLSPPNRVLFL